MRWVLKQARSTSQQLAAHTGKLAVNMACSTLTVVALLLGMLLSGAARADEACCARCGCKCECEKVCKLVCEDKKVPVNCWGCKYEDFCLPGPNQPGCKHVEDVCEPDGKARDAPDCAKGKNFLWREWIPGCATMHTKTKLMKKTVNKKVPSFKWVVEDLCESCREKAAAGKESVSPPPPRALP